jgi:glycerol kinase
MPRERSPAEWWPRLLALDAGTTSSRAILFDERGAVLAVAQREFRQLYPQPGWVEHDAEEIWRTQIEVAAECIAQSARRRRSRRSASPISARPPWSGTAPPASRSQRDRVAGPPHRCLLRRAARRGRTSRSSAHAPASCSIPTSPARSSLAARHVPVEPRRSGDLAFGTIDSWLIWNLTGGAHARHRRHERLAHAALRHPPLRLGRRAAVDPRRAALDAARSARVERSRRRRQRRPADPRRHPIAGIAGDQQAALFGQRCTRPAWRRTPTAPAVHAA